VEINSIYLWLAIGWSFVAFGVWYDARSSSSRSAFLWALAVFLGGPLGIVLYFLLGRDEASGKRTAGESLRSEEVTECPECGGIEERNRSVCRFCGAEM
jgi:hypothetical protein